MCDIQQQPVIEKPKVEIPKDVEVVYVKHGVASRYGNLIEMNVNLVGYPELHDDILKHELDHSKGGIKGDFMPNYSIPQYLSFLSNNPSALTQFIPVGRNSKKEWFIDKPMVSIYIFFAVVIAGILMIV